MRILTSPWVSGSTLLGLISMATTVAVGCDGGETNTGGNGGTTTTTSQGGGGDGGTTTTSQGGGGEGGTTTTSQGGGGEGGTTTTSSTTTSSTTSDACTVTATGETRGSAIAISAKDDILVSVNRDVGTVSVFAVDYASGTPAITKKADVVVGAVDSEPWQVAMNACGTVAYVVLRKEQKVVEITGLDTATPTVGKSASTGSEPTGIAITPNNTQVYVTNWVDGTVTAIATDDMTVSNTVDLNPALAATGLLGPTVEVTPRAALAHPRAIAISNNGDASDADETIVVTEWFAQRTAPEDLAGVTIDTNWKGLLYKLAVASDAVTTLNLPPVLDTGFKDHNNAVTGCFPNQVGSVAIHNGFAYVTSTCASPKGPIGVFAGKNAGGACTPLTEAADCGALGGTCNAVTLVCNPNITDVKTTTHPAVSIVNIADGTGATTPLDKPYVDLLATSRLPLLPTDIAFKNNFAYVAGSGTDALFRFNAAANTVGAAGAGAGKEFINLRKDAMDKLIRMPIGVAIANETAFGFVANDGSRDVTAIDFNSQAIAKDAANAFVIAQAAPLPDVDTKEDKVLKGKRFFNTGLGRWSLGGQGWGACAACHIDGLSDNVTWYFARGPRQSVSLDGSFSKTDPTDQRIFNWTGIFDEVADFEGNTRGISGGVGAIVSVNNSPPTNADRINTAAESPPQQGLQGSSADTASPTGTGAHPHGVLTDWEEITEWVKTVRPPRKPTNLVAADVTAGKTLFGSANGNCVGCHSGSKWTISNVFWPVGDAANAATNSMNAESLGQKDWSAAATAAGYPALLFPVEAPPAVLGTDSRMRFGAPPGAEQIQCILKPVGTIKAGADTSGVSPAAVNVIELRQDMLTKGQGAAATGRGFNPPSLLGMQVGAPYFHAGNARTLEEAFDAMFAGHHQSPVAAVFSPDANQKRQLVAYILSIDTGEMPFTPPNPGNKGGDICFYP